LKWIKYTSLKAESGRWESTSARLDVALLYDGVAVAVAPVLGVEVLRETGTVEIIGGFLTAVNVGTPGTVVLHGVTNVEHGNAIVGSA